MSQVQKLKYHTTISLPKFFRKLQKPARQQGRDRNVEHFALPYGRASALQKPARQQGRYRHVEFRPPSPSGFCNPARSGFCNLVSSFRKLQILCENVSTLNL
jgi:hypothetical protein